MEISETINSEMVIFDILILSIFHPYMLFLNTFCLITLCISKHFYHSMVNYSSCLICLEHFSL